MKRKVRVRWTCTKSPCDLGSQEKEVQQWDPATKDQLKFPLAELADSGNTDEPLVVSGQATVGQVEGGWEHVELEYVGGEEEDEEWMLIEDDKKDVSTEGGKPPEVSDEELEKLDEAAARKEIEKLKRNGCNRRN